MGFWDLFRKKKQEVETETVRFSEVGSWLEKEKSGVEKKEKEFLEEVKANLNQLIRELEQEIVVLENFDVNSKKAEERIKFIVKENLSYYLDHLKKLMSKLRELGEDVDVEKISSAFDYFEKKSSANFQKATILIGKEMGDVRESLRKFMRSLAKILENNNSVVSKSKKLNSIGRKLNKISENNKREREVEGAIKDCDSQIKKLKEEINSKKQSIVKVESSSEFLEFKKKETELEKMKLELDRLFSQLKSLIDFKGLANFYHSFEKEMAVVKNHRDSFRSAFEKNPQSLLSLLQESKLSNEKIEDKISEVRMLQEKIRNTEIDDLGISFIKKAINVRELKIREVEDKKVGEEKKKSKLVEENSQIKKEIVEELKGINVEVV